MAPTVSWRAGSAPSNPTIRDGILAACQQAAGSADFSNFQTMEIWTGRHTSQSDKNNHATTRLKTVVQISNGTHQVAHVYMDANYVYTGHQLYPTVKKD